MKRLTPALFVLTACWDSPTPEVPSGVEVLLSEKPVYRASCGDPAARYIGDVAFGDGYIYAVTYQWQAPTDGDNCGGNNETFDVPVIRKPLPGSGGENDSFDAGKANSGTVSTRVAGASTLGAWVHAPNDQSSNLEFYFDPGKITNPLLISTNGLGGFFLPMGFVADDTHGYLVATTQQTLSRDINEPRYPAGATNGGGQMAPATLARRIEWSTGSATTITLPPGMYAIGDTLKTSLVSNTTTLFVAVRDAMDQESDVEIHAVAKDMLTSTTKLGTVLRENGVPVGIAATDTTLAWTVSSFFPTNGAPPSPRCGLFVRDLAGGSMAERIYTSFEHDCMDVALDETHAYFAITQADKQDSSPGAYGMRGIGLARVQLAPPHTFESIDLGINTDFSGPRRVWLDGEYLIAAEPFTVVRIRKNVLAGKTQLFP